MKKRFFGLLALLLVLAACTQPGPRSVTVVTSPQPNAVDVEVDTDVTATFSVAMNESTLEDAMSLSSEEGPVAGTQSYDADARRLTFTPDEPLEFGTEYTASVDRAVRSDAGGRLAGPTTGLYSWTFTTVESPDAEAAVTVTPNPAAALVGANVEFSAEVVGLDSADVTWTSSDTDVATIDEDGVATALADGTTTITATSVADPSVFGTAELTVTTEPAVTQVTVEPETAELELGTTVQLTATVVATAGAEESVTWATGDANIATVDEDGLVTAVAPGIVTVTATSDFDASVSGEAVITVLGEAVNSVTVTPSELTLAVGDDPVQLTAEVDAVSGADDTVTWSSGDPSVATVDGTGLVTPMAPGTVTITATSDFDDSVTGSATVTVPGVSGLTISPASANIPVGETVQFETDAVVVGGVDDSVTWSSDEPGIATVDPDGLVTAVAPGVATITATSVATPTISVTAEVTVVAPLSAEDYETDAFYLPGVAFDIPAPAVSGGVAPYTYELTGGSLPAGVTLGADGAISGSSTDSGPYSGTVTVTDALGATDTAEFSFGIGEAMEILDPPYFGQTLQVGNPITSVGLLVTGGVGPITYAVVEIDPDDAQWADRYDDGIWSYHADIELQGPLAPGLSIDDSTGVLSGTVTEVGFFRTYIRVTDAIGQTDVVQLEIDVEALPLELTYTPDSYGYTAGAALHVPADNITVTGGVGPYSFSWARTSCGDPLDECSDEFWLIDDTNGELDRVVGGLTEEHNRDRTYRVTVTDSAGTTATFDVSFEEAL